MKRNGLIWFLLAVLLIVAVLLVMNANSSGKKYNWEERLSFEGAQPYDLGAFQKVLNFKYEQVDKSLNNSFSKLLTQGSTDYFAVGKRLYFQRQELDTLHRFVKNGGKVFLAFHSISDTALLKLGVPSEYLETTQVYDSSQELHFTSKEFNQWDPFHIAYHNSLKTQSNYLWTYFVNSSQVQEEIDLSVEEEDAYVYDDDYDDVFVEDEEEDWEESEEEGRGQNEVPMDTIIDALEENDIQLYIDESFYYGQESLNEVSFAYATSDILVNEFDQVCFKKFNIGKGEVYLLLNPILLGNFYQTQDSTRKLLAGLMSHFSSKNAILDIESTQFKLNSISVGRTKTPLSYMLSKKWFSYGLYFLLLIAILFMVFQSIRKYKVVPVYLTPKNRSIEQVRDVASVISAEKNIRLARDYYCVAFENWHQNHHLHYQYGHKVDDPELKRCQILASKSVWDGKDLKEFAQLYNQLIMKYGK